MSKLIGIEGSSYVGKTTVANQLFEMGFKVIPEYDTFGPFPESDGSVKGLKSVIDELLDRERQRCELIEPHKINFEDRTVVSLITFEEMKILHAHASDSEKVHTEVRDYATRRIIQLSETGQITSPDGIAVLRINDNDEFDNRVKKRGLTAVGELTLFATQLHIARKSVEHAASLLGDGVCAMLEVDKKLPQTLAKELIKFAERL